MTVPAYVCHLSPLDSSFPAAARHTPLQLLTCWCTSRYWSWVQVESELLWGLDKNRHTHGDGVSSLSPSLLSPPLSSLPSPLLSSPRYIPSAVDHSNVGLTGGCFLLQQGIQRRIAMTIMYETGSNIKWIKVNELVVGESSIRISYPHILLSSCATSVLASYTHLSPSPHCPSPNSLHSSLGRVRTTPQSSLESDNQSNVLSLNLFKPQYLEVDNADR